MALLEELKPGVLLKGLLPGNLVTVIDSKRQGSICVELTYKDANGHFDSVLLYRESEPRIEIASEGLPWSFGADGATFRLTSEAYRINLAYLLRPTDSRAYLANPASATSKIYLVRDIIMAACIRCNTALNLFENLSHLGRSKVYSTCDRQINEVLQHLEHQMQQLSDQNNVTEQFRAYVLHEFANNHIPENRTYYLLERLDYLKYLTYIKQTWGQNSFSCTKNCSDPMFV